LDEWANKKINNAPKILYAETQKRFGELANKPINDAHRRSPKRASKIEVNQSNVTRVYHAHDQDTQRWQEQQRREEEQWEQERKQLDQKWKHREQQRREQHRTRDQRQQRQLQRIEQETVRINALELEMERFIKKLHEPTPHHYTPSHGPSIFHVLRSVQSARRRLARYQTQAS
jgi:hypothetical protein